MAQHSFIKASSDTLVAATPDTKAWLSRIKKGAVLYADFKKARNPAFFRKFFSLLNLGFDYWCPAGGVISPADRELVHGYVKFVAYYAGHGATLEELADQYLREESEKRAVNISAVKSFEVFRRWVTIEAGFYDTFQMPDGSILREPKSISFAAMEDYEFAQLYSAVIDVLWNYMLFRTFPSQEAAENAAAQLMDYAS
ncbi:DUF1367 family protein [Salmonella enterica subsp. enterica]|nr:DUF1367 family protein [Salmonella enterica subsp. enterica]